MLLGLGACHSPTNSKPNDNLAAQKDTIAAGSLAPTYEIADYDTIHINGYTLYFEPYDSTREYTEPNMHSDTNNYRTSRNIREAKELEKCSNCFTRVNDTLILTFGNGKTEGYIDNNEEDDEHFAHYEFDGVANGYYFVYGYFWEWADVRMINSANGYMVTLLRRPYFAPSNKGLVTICSDLEAHYEPNGIKYYQIVAADSIQEQFSVEIENWGPSAMYWLNDSTTILEKEALSGKNNPPYTYTYTKMTIRKP